MKNKYLLFFISLILLLYPIMALGEWTPMESGTTEYLDAVWGSSGIDVFAVGWHTILHYNGSSWSPMTIGTNNWLKGVWGSSGSDVFAVGEQFSDGDWIGTILHYNDKSWSPMTIGTTAQLYGIWGSSSSDVFAAGQNGTILHYDGSDWSSMESGTTEPLSGVWGSSGTDVFAVGGDTVLHYNGSSWSPMASGTTAHLSGIWGNSPDDIFAVGGSLAYTTCICDGWDCRFFPDTCVITYGPFQVIKHFNGVNWSEITSKNSPIAAVWGSSSSDVFAVGDGGILHYNGSTWSVMTSGTTEPLSGVWGSSGTDVFAVGRSGTILHYGSGGCPAKTVLGESNSGIYKLRVFRKEMFIKADEGKYYTSLYYKHGPELSDIFAHNEELKEKATILIQSIMPAIETLLVKKETIIDEDTVQKSMELIDALRTQAGPELEKGLNSLKKGIQSGRILKTFKVKIRKN